MNMNRRNLIKTLTMSQRFFGIAELKLDVLNQRDGWICFFE